MNPINEPFYPTASVFANEQQNFWTVIAKASAHFVALMS